MHRSGSFLAPVPRAALSPSAGGVATRGRGVHTDLGGARPGDRLEPPAGALSFLHYLQKLPAGASSSLPSETTWQVHRNLSRTPAFRVFWSFKLIVQTGCLSGSIGGPKRQTVSRLSLTHLQLQVSLLSQVTPGVVREGCACAPHSLLPWAALMQL